MMITRREGLKSLALAAGALAIGSQSNPAAAQGSAEPHKVPALGYDYDALEPFIDAETMKIHHDKHHAAYVAKLNQALAKHPHLAAKPLDTLLSQLDAQPEDIRNDLRNHGGGHANHSLFWQCLKKGGSAPAGALLKDIETHFKNQQTLEEQLVTSGLKVFGSGWVWLAVRDAKLVVETSPNQDSPVMSGAKPLLGIDVYYLKYQNKRADYLAAMMKLINWDFVAARHAGRA
jgi:Fe-Mn family superoxide dismutase